THDELAKSQLDKGGEHCVEVSIVTGVQDTQLEPERLCSLLHVFRIGLGIGVVRVHKHGEYSSRGHHFAQQLHALSYQHARNHAHARHVATGAVEAPDRATPDSAPPPQPPPP